ncbi:MAG: LamG-like jellyroll fold domain-containing protein, partial [Paludibacter sp.]|nr:LamG-like jellyroll fold domain-containing protein [Paludibacter sp.]
TDNSVVDVDADTVLQVGKFDHFTAVYSGYSMELYRNGLLSGFKPLTGQILTTAKSLTISRKDEGTSDYNFRGTVDEVRIYNEELAQSIIALLPTTFKLKAGIEDTIIIDFKVYPNPFSNEVNISLPTGENISRIEVFSLVGKKVFQTTNSSTNIQINIPNGFYILKITASSGNAYKTKIIKKD